MVSSEIFLTPTKGKLEKKLRFEDTMDEKVHPYDDTHELRSKLKLKLFIDNDDSNPDLSEAMDVSPLSSSKDETADLSSLPATPSKMLFPESPDISSPVTSFKTPQTSRNFGNRCVSHSPSLFPEFSPVNPMTPHRFSFIPPTEFEDLEASPPHGFDISTLSICSVSRPLPDQSAFDTSITNSNKSKTPLRSPMCPPTPVRRKGWYDSARKPNRLARQSSLSTTKVLLSLDDGDINMKAEDDTEQFFNEFEYLGWIGTGSFADVYKMKSINDGNIYAIKKSKRPFRSKKDRDALLQEVLIYNLLAQYHTEPCPNLIRYFRAWQEVGHIFMQIELCERGSLKDLIEELPVGISIPEQTIWIIANEILKGLMYLHEAGVVHLDIKPQNVFVSSDGTLKIGDFGMAIKIVDAENSFEEGDSFYMAKELLQSREHMTAADVFSLGITLYEIATLVGLPQDGESWHDLREGKNPRIPLQYSDALESFIRWLMLPNPNERPSVRQIKEVIDQQLISDSSAIQFIIEYSSTRMTDGLHPPILLAKPDSPPNQYKTHWVP